LLAVDEPLAVVATLSKGYDLDYIWKQVDSGPAKDAASYYIQASETGGEPPGRWWGPGAQALGLAPGQTVKRKPYDLLFGERRYSQVRIFITQWIKLEQLLPFPELAGAGAICGYSFILTSLDVSRPDKAAAAEHWYRHRTTVENLFRDSKLGAAPAAAARPRRSGCVRFEPHGAEVVSCGQAYVGIQRGGQAPQQGNGGLGTAFFDALDLIDGHVSASGQFGGTQT
jgi:hypothetical protein